MDLNSAWEVEKRFAISPLGKLEKTHLGSSYTASLVISGPRPPTRVLPPTTTRGLVGWGCFDREAPEQISFRMFHAEHMFSELLVPIGTLSAEQIGSNF